MNDLSTLLNRMSPPEVPDSVSDADAHLILALLESGKQQMRPYTGTFNAPWLLTPFDSDVWETSNRGREELVAGIWKGTISIDWRVLLPNNKLLTDARYSYLLTHVKKLAFFMRSNMIPGTSAPVAWNSATYRLICVVRWVILHEQKFHPELYGFRLIDQPALEWLFSEYSMGGWTRAMQIPHRLLTVIYRGAHGVECPKNLLDNPNEIPITELGALVKWMEQHELYTSVILGTHFGKRYLGRDRLALLINENNGNLSGSSITRFCRQFEPDFANETLLVSVKQHTEFPSQWTEPIKEIDEGLAEGSLKALSGLFKSILEAHLHLPNFLPEPSTISTSRAFRLATHFTRASGHTPFMPVNTGLTYLNEALRFVSLYGDAIVGLYLATLPNRKARNRDLNIYMKRNMKDWCIASGEPITSILNITEFRRQEGTRDFNRFRLNPTLDDALRVLIGACIICISQLKPSREEELTHLKRNCIRHDGSGYWFNYELGKSNVKGVEAWQELDRPIPVITAKAIQLLQRLGEGISEKCGNDRKYAHNLFYLPKTNGFGTSTPSKDLLTDHLDCFCDFVGMPLDNEGRRWYIRIHEMRKWFLLLLFWSGRFDVLDAARWIAGHTDAQHIYAYIEKEFPGEELPKLESEYAADRLYRQDQARRRGQGASGKDDGADALYQKVLHHFNVESLAVVPESEWAAYVHALRKSDEFHLEPHSIFGINGCEVVGLSVSFVMREVP